MVATGNCFQIISKVIRAHVFQIVFLIQLGAGTQDVFHLIAVNQLVHQLFFQETVGLKGDHNAVTQHVQRRRLQFAVLGDAVSHLVPDDTQVVFGLQAVGLAHVIEHVRLNGTLESAHTHNLHLDAHLV